MSPKNNANVQNDAANMQTSTESAQRKETLQQSPPQQPKKPELDSGEGKCAALKL